MDRRVLLRVKAAGVYILLERGKERMEIMYILIILCRLNIVYIVLRVSVVMRVYVVSQQKVRCFKQQIHMLELRAGGPDFPINT